MIYRTTKMRKYIDKVTVVEIERNENFKTNCFYGKIK